MAGFLFVDKITDFKAGQFIRGVKHVTNDDVYCMRVDDAEPVFWPALIGETLGQLCAWNVMYTMDFKKRPVAGMSKQAIMHDYARIGDTIDLLSEIETLDDQAVLYNSKAWVNDKLIFELHHALGPLLPMSDFISEAEVRKQFSSIFPCSQSHFSMRTDHANWIVEGYDRITRCEPGETMVAVKTAKLGAPYFPDHFPNKPVLPLTVLLQCHVSLAQPFLQTNLPGTDLKSLRVTCFKKIKMSRFVQPGDFIETQVKLVSHDDHHAELEFSTYLEQRRICVAKAEFTF